MHKHDLIAEQSAKPKTVDTKLKNTSVNLEEENHQLKQQVNNLQQLIYNMAHNLRAPIASVLGIVQLLELDKEDSEAYYKMMHSCLKKLDNEIQNVLSYSRNSNSEVYIEELDLEELVKGTWNSLQYMNNASELNFEFSNNIIAPFFSDLKRMNVILLNLLSNAIKYHHPQENGAFIHVRTYEDEHFYFLEFADNGDGMDYKTQQNIFNMFYRGSDKSEGSGLGMYIVKEAINKLQGYIKVSSEIDQGSTFLVKLPKQYN